MEENIFFEDDGRKYKKEPFVKQVPRYTFLRGVFTGKFYSDKKETENEKDEFFEFKIYKGEVEILEKSIKEFRQSDEEITPIKIEKSQLPEKIRFFEKNGGQKKYYNLNVENAKFQNFKFVKELQQNEGEEAFGTVNAEFYGFVTDFLPEKYYKKRYALINLIGKKNQVKENIEENKKKKKDDETNITKINDGIKTEKEPISVVSDKVVDFYNTNRCRNNLLISLAITIFSLIIGFTPTFIIGLIWLLYVIYKCYFSFLKYLAYLFGILFLIGLVYSILNTNWNARSNPYIPKIVENSRTRPILVKEIVLISEDGKSEDILLKRKMTWFSYAGEKYEGEYFIKKSDLNQSSDFKNRLSHQTSYPNILYQLQQNDKDKLGSLYEMFLKIKNEKKLNDKLFAEMVVCFVQQIPYYLVLEKTCNSQDYPEEFIKKMLKENPGKCSPNQKFGITSPVEFMGNLQGDCDSRTLLLHTILKHFNYDAIVISSDIYQHSMLGINLPYSGQVFNSMGSRYTVWETTSPNFVPGNIPLQVSNMDNWYLTLK